MEEDIKLLLSYIETEINEGKKPIIGNGVIVNGQAILKLIERIRVALPLATGEDKILQATEKAREIIEIAEQRKANIIDDDIATREAKAKAGRIIQHAMLEKARIERNLAQNCYDMVAAIQKTVNKASQEISEVCLEADKAFTSAIERVEVKLD